MCMQRPEARESKRVPPPPPAPVDVPSSQPPPPPAMQTVSQDIVSSSNGMSDGLEAGQDGPGHSLAISIPSTPPPADSAASSPASINTTLSAPAGSGSSRASAAFRATNSKYNQQRSGPGSRWPKGAPRSGTLPNSPVGPSGRGLAMANGFGPGGLGMPVTAPGRGQGKGPGGRGRGRGSSQRQDPNAAPAFHADSWQQSQAAAAAAFYQTQVCLLLIWGRSTARPCCEDCQTCALGG